ncbi:MAG: hypothetical protein NZM12_10340, partial [Steroidobacteraceae bacterium]|nr:hypothetical protein [Steroidobacteraceae bacterium]MDW8259014.1 hypothetical protein [Gammaproteobacteria bacterium]
MSALQRRYFGRRRRRAIVRSIAPMRRRYRRGAYSRRRFRRSVPATFRANLPTAVNAAQTAAAGAVGAVVMDVVMSQAARVLPTALATRFDERGGINYGYHLTRAALTIGVGALGAHFLPAGARSWAVRGAVGALTVQAYEILRSFVPVDWTMGYYFNPARIVAGGMQGMRGRLGQNNGGRYMRLPTPTMTGMGASFPHGTAFPLHMQSESRIGEGPTY